MASQRIRPSLADLYDEPAFPELEPGQAPAARVVRERPPALISASSLPPPIPVVPPTTASEATQPAPAKPKSRFTLQREKDAAERAAAPAPGAAQRFHLDFDGQGAAEGEGELERGGGALPRAGRPSIVRGVVERPAGARTGPPKPPSAPGPPIPSPLAGRPTGFPSSSRGLFPRKAAPAPPMPPAHPGIVDSLEDEDEGSADATSVHGLLESVSRENDDILRGMSEAQILEEQRQIREELGLSEGVLRMLQERGKKRAPVPMPRVRPAPAGAQALQEKVRRDQDDEADDEGSPEYIRRHFFPNEPQNPALDWMRPPKPASDAETSACLPPAARLSFDVQGRMLADSEASAVPSGAADHHVSSSTTFTVPSLLSLTASSVPFQRSTAFSILQRILARADEYAPRFGEQEWQALRVQAAQRAGWALRDPNLGVVGGCVALLATLLAQDVAAPPAEALPRVEGAEEPTTIVSTFLATTPLASLASHLSIGALPRASLLSILSIVTSLVNLSRASTSAGDLLDAIYSTPRLLESIVSMFLAVPYPPTSSSASPAPAALALLSLLVRTSRTRASLLCTRGLIDPTLRFVALPPWELPASSAAARALGDALLRGTIDLWTTLGRYGLATDLRGKAAPLLDGLVERVGELRRAGAGLSSAAADAGWMPPFLGLLSIWTTAAIDPHVTGHDVTWSQVQGWRDVALEAGELGFALVGADDDAVGCGGREVLSAAWGLFGSWLEGSKVNRSWRGEDERKWVIETLGPDFAAGGRARVLLDRALVELGGEKEKDSEGEAWARLAASALRLSDAYADEFEPATPQLFGVDAAVADAVVRAAAAATPTGPASIAVAVLLLPRLDLPARVTATVDLLPRLGVQNAVTARDLIDWLLDVIARPENRSLAPVTCLDPILELPSLAQSAILRPFLAHTIVTATGGRVVGPLFPTTRDIKLTGCLAPFAPPGPVLSPNWPLAALAELLRSASSPVFRQLPKDWDASELQLVRASLALMRFVRAAGSADTRTDSPPALVYELVKVFMLEKDNGGATTGASGAEGEVFRDEACQFSMGALLGELSIGKRATPQILAPDMRAVSETLEGVSALVSSAPFYQLYTDLVGLYDAISLSDRLFGLVLLPPLAMAYPVDYRRLLWTDYAHLLPTLRFAVPDAIGDVVPGGGVSGVLGAYLAPRETSEPMLAAYVDALASGRVTRAQTPFVHLIALHHVAAAFEVGGPSAQKLAKALVLRGAMGTLQEVVRYRQAKEGEVLVPPPACFEADAGERRDRVQRLKELVGSELADKVEELVGHT
ncbi:hypothetical protein JCM3770_000941 [Rhodotorula araucariae]